MLLLHLHQTRSHRAQMDTERINSLSLCVCVCTKLSPNTNKMRCRRELRTDTKCQTNRQRESLFNRLNQIKKKERRRWWWWCKSKRKKKTMSKTNNNDDLNYFIFDYSIECGQAFGIPSDFKSLRDTFERVYAFCGQQIRRCRRCLSHLFRDDRKNLDAQF